MMPLLYCAKDNRKKCLYCEATIVKGEKAIEFINSSFGGKTSTRAIHLMCFLEKNIDELKHLLKKKPYQEIRKTKFLKSV